MFGLVNECLVQDLVKLGFVFDCTLIGVDDRCVLSISHIFALFASCFDFVVNYHEKSVTVSATQFFTQGTL